MDTPYSVVELAETGSTQDDARALFAGEPVLVVAARQTRGRGRTGATWQTAPRAVAASLAFAPGWAPESWPLLPLLAGLAACRGLAGVRLKWPNDLVVGDEKAGGLLVEATGHLVVAGLGLNLWWPGAPEGMTALHGDDPGPEAPRRVAEAWARRLGDLVAGEPDAWPRGEYRDLSATIGRDVTWETEDGIRAGRAVDVAADGGLVVEAEGAVLVLRSGAVRHVRPRD